MSVSILPTYFSRIELQIGSDPEFTRIFGAKVNAVAGSRYTVCRGHTSLRHVHLCILTEAGLKLAETILSRFPAYAMILHYPLKTAGGMRMIDGYPMRVCGNPGPDFRSAYLNASSDLIITRAKGVLHHDLSALVSLVEREVERHHILRVANALAQAMVGIKQALISHAKSWREHADLMAEVRLGFDIAFERIELRVLKGELKPESEALAMATNQLEVNDISAEHSPETASHPDGYVRVVARLLEVHENRSSAQAMEVARQMLSASIAGSNHHEEPASLAA